MLTFFDKLINPTLLIVLNILILVASEFVGGGTYFDESGMIHAVAIVFVVLIVIRILSDYAYGDAMLKTFSKIQVGFFLFLGIIHVYEYLGLNVLPMRAEIVEFSVLSAYLLWFLGNVIALEFMFRSYTKRATFWCIPGCLLTGLLTVYLVWLNFSHNLIDALPSWAPHAALFAVFALAIGTSVALSRLKVIMPIFENYGKYAIAANVFVAIVAFSEYTEATGILTDRGFSATQNLYLSHYPVFIALSLLLVAVGKFKRPTGIYADL